jgi:hypothetical protein
MDSSDSKQSDRLKRFEDYNPYANRITGDDLEDEILAQLAVAYEISQLRTEIHFASKRGRS